LSVLKFGFVHRELACIRGLHGNPAVHDERGKTRTEAEQQRVTDPRNVEYEKARSLQDERERYTDPRLLDPASRSIEAVDGHRQGVKQRSTHGEGQQGLEPGVFWADQPEKDLRIDDREHKDGGASAKCQGEDLDISAQE